MKILQLNIWGGRLGKQIIELLEREQADVVCFQEAVNIPGGEGFLIKGIEEITEQAGYPNLVFNAQHSFKLMRRTASFGLAILSKLPLIETHEFFTRLEHQDDFDILEDDYNIRSLQMIAVEEGERRVHILNHHGHHVPDHKHGNEETLRQCQMIVDYIDTLSGPVVLCGDFNLAPNSESLQLINQKLINHAKERGALTTRTILTKKTEVCDYIFTSPNLTVTDFQILDDIASDHMALTVTI